MTELQAINKYNIRIVIVVGTVDNVERRFKAVNMRQRFAFRPAYGTKTQAAPHPSLWKESGRPAHGVVDRKEGLPSNPHLGCCGCPHPYLGVGIAGHFQRYWDFSTAEGIYPQKSAGYPQNE
jgi:hypothetical protein